MDKNAVLMMVIGIILLAAGVYGAWYFVEELILVVKGLIGLVIALLGLFLLIVGIFTVKD
ncbi:conserved hypothetical protein [Methanolacinia petrolearia DSM 11571]|uniref:Uncharacterized protein n=1 Tax=Methanolacinia petrolearia (strain DSM 11571 / OCM 486 / SEBR 4847) TaxID=679926 RepID=E1RK61_METP4|nr:hypothetical protein [Methanolacinia petrolearia]ADN35784.1 conserved hypothetical protein [Methanolacinia petrolearia DSM 11571]